MQKSTTIALCKNYNPDTPITEISKKKAIKQKVNALKGIWLTES